MLKWKTPYFANVAFLARKALEDIVLIEEPIVDHVWIHDIKLTVLYENVVLLQVLARCQLLCIAVDLAVLVLDVVVVVLGGLLQALVLVEELWRGRLDLLLYLEHVFSLMTFNIASERYHPITVDDVPPNRKWANLYLVSLLCLVLKLIL